MGKAKILAIKFKYLGDTALMVPALRVLRKNHPDASLEVLVNEGAVDILEHIPWIDKVWGLPKGGGKKIFTETLPLLWKLRKNRFDISVDFVGNDRGALVSRFIGAKKRVGLNTQKGFLGRKYCYTHPAAEASEKIHESLRDIATLAPLGLASIKNQDPELHSDPQLKGYAKQLVPEGTILCHISTTRPKKEWPADSWARLYNENPQLRNKLIFTTGPTNREQALLKELEGKAPGMRTIRPIPTVAHFMALIKSASGIICNDSLPAHLASGLNTPIVVFFGPTTVSQWEPKGKSIVLAAENCRCLGHSPCCLEKVHCLSKIEPTMVAQALRSIIKE